MQHGHRSSVSANILNRNGFTHIHNMLGGIYTHRTSNFGKGFDSRDAVTVPTWTYSRRPLTDTPAPKFDQQRVYTWENLSIPLEKPDETKEVK
ncbi:hypothetical protein EQU24_14725 [Methylotuvimicrobium buryatense]|uniref:Uncharacterized protein n=1 Tax=Methylotuvimicrobium buryatense TaxID=95641 RepID=A0A4P9UUJ7_METBY|nr:hypothetical protein EQU24_14725 [Methylotuvimicrobium buryatense]